MDSRMLPLSFRLEDAGQVPRAVGYESPWRRFGNTMISHLSAEAFRIELAHGKTYELSDGMSFLMPPGCRHRIKNTGQRLATAHFTHLHCRIYELQGMFPFLNEPIIFAGAVSQHVAKCIQEIIAAKQLPVTLRASTRVASCLAELVEHAVAACPTLEEQWQNPERQRLMPVLQYIQDHIADPLDRQRIAEVAGLSVPHLHTIFVKAFGAAPMEVLRRERMQHASQLLHWSDFPIAEVAAKCGFEDQYYFSRAFKKREGVSPSTYRRDVRS